MSAWQGERAATMAQVAIDPTDMDSAHQRMDEDQAASGAVRRAAAGPPPCTGAATTQGEQTPDLLGRGDMLRTMLTAAATALGAEVLAFTVRPGATASAATASDISGSAYGGIDNTGQLGPTEQLAAVSALGMLFLLYQLTDANMEAARIKDAGAHNVFAAELASYLPHAASAATQTFNLVVTTAKQQEKGYFDAKINAALAPYPTALADVEKAFSSTACRYSGANSLGFGGFVGMVHVATNYVKMGALKANVSQPLPPYWRFGLLGSSAGAAAVAGLWPLAAAILVWMDARDRAYPATGGAGLASPTLVGSAGSGPNPQACINDHG